MKKLLAWFTLIELTITTIILALLIIVLFNVYIITGQIAVKIQSERNLHNETLYVMQTLQNIVDDWTLSITWYSLAWLEDTYGIVDQLILVWDTYRYILQRSCTTTWGVCVLELEKFDPFTLETVTLILTDPNRIDVTNFYIKLLPFGEQSDFDNISHEWFRLFLDVQVPYYSDQNRWFNVRQQLQTFFNVRQY